MEEDGQMSETSAFKTLKNNLVGSRINRRLDRVENVVVGGWPDTNGCFSGVEFHIEIKAPKEPKRATTPLFGSNHKLSQDQKNWIKRQMNSGGLAYVYIDTGKNRMLIGGSFADDINEMTVGELASIALWHATVPVRNKGHWERIADVIAERKV
jgi:hypothetical protein